MEKQLYDLALLHDLHVQLFGRLPPPLIPVSRRQVAAQRIWMLLSKHPVFRLHDLHNNLLRLLPPSFSRHPEEMKIFPVFHNSLLLSQQPAECFPGQKLINEAESRRLQGYDALNQSIPQQTQPRPEYTFETSSRGSTTDVAPIFLQPWLLFGPNGLERGGVLFLKLFHALCIRSCFCSNLSIVS